MMTMTTMRMKNDDDDNDDDDNEDDEEKEESGGWESYSAGGTVSGWCRALPTHYRPSALALPTLCGAW